MREINKVFTGKLNSDDSDFLLPENDYRDALNIRIKKNENSGRVERAKGNVLEAYRDNPARVCIGTCEDVAEQSLIEFYFDPSGNHAIYRYYPDSKISKKLIEWEGLNFSINHPVQALVLDRKLIWVDGLNEARMIRMNRPDLYADIGQLPEDTAQVLVSFQKPAPSFAPVVEQRFYEPDYGASYIKGKSLQFAYRLTYLDGEVSPLSPYSEVSHKSTLFVENTTAGRTVRDSGGDLHLVSVIHDDNVIYVRYPEVQYRDVARVDFLVRDSETASFVIYRSYEVNNNFRNNPVTLDLYQGNEGTIPLSSSEQSRLFDLIPVKPTSVSFCKGRIFFSGGSDTLPSPQFSDSITISYRNQNNETQTELEAQGISKAVYFKNNSRYKLGLAYYDRYGRTDGVRLVTDVRIDNVPKRLIKASASNIYTPDWATHFRYCLTNNLDGDNYMVVPANVYFFVGEDPEITDRRIGTTTWINGGRRYQVNRQRSISNFGSYNRLHVELPSNIPFIPDTSYRVRMVGSEDRGVKVMNVYEGNILEVDNIPNHPTDNDDYLDTRIEIEVYKEEAQADKIFYERGPLLPINELIHPVYLMGDEHYVDSPTNETLGNNLQLQWVFESSLSLAEPSWFPYLRFETYFMNRGLPTPLFKSSEFVRSIRVGSTMSRRPPSYTPDYEAIFRDRGRALSERINLPSNLERVVRFSDFYVENSNNNGYTTFLAGNDYALQADNGAINQLVGTAAGLTCLHEQGATALYIGEGFIREGDGAILAKSDGVIGDERAYAAKHGCVNPESVVQHEGRIYYFDFLRREPCRVSQDGITPLATTFKMKRYFNELVARMIDGVAFDEDVPSPVQYGLFVAGGYDAEHNEYLMSFYYKQAESEVNPVVHTQSYAELTPPKFGANTLRLKNLKADTPRTMYQVLMNGFTIGTYNLFTNQFVDIQLDIPPGSIVTIIPRNTGGLMSYSTLWLVPDSYIHFDTIGYSEETKGFTSRYSFGPERFGKLGNKLFSIQGGVLYRHGANNKVINAAAFNTSLRYVVNAEPAAEKQWEYMKVQGGKGVDTTFTAEDEPGIIQESSLLTSDFELLNGTYFAPMLRDIHTQGLPAGTLALLEGNPMRSRVLNVKLDDIEQAEIITHGYQ